MRNDVGHRLAVDRVKQEDRADDDQRKTDAAPGGFKQQQYPGTAEQRLKRYAESRELEFKQDSVAADDAVIGDPAVGTDREGKSANPGRQQAATCS